MYEIQKDQSVPVKFFAGEYPVVTAVKAVATGKSVKQYEPVKLTDSGIEPVVKVAASEAVSGTSTPAKSCLLYTSIRRFAAAIGNRLERYIGGQQVKSLPKQKTGVPPLAAPDFQKLMPGRKGKFLQNFGHNGRRRF